MKQLALCCLLGMGLVAMALAEDAKNDATKKDRMLLEGTWQAVSLEVNGEKSDPADARKISVINGADGIWSLRSDGQEVARGTNSLDGSKSPKTIDLVPLDGDKKGELYLGIYEINEKTRRLCFAPPLMARPTEFATQTGNQWILVTFERVKAK